MAPAEINVEELRHLREATREMFETSFDSYMKHAFPRDHLKPISCTGEDFVSLGIAVTLVDCLDTLLMMNRTEEIRAAQQQLGEILMFDKDVSVHVFETSIRVLGGLISGHVLLTANPNIMPEYDGMYLDKARELADRLLPAFNTASQLPYLWVNLRTGHPTNQVTCTACAGTFLMELGALSKLTGDSKYLDKARAAAVTMYERRSPLGLVGGAMDVSTSSWTSRESTIGPGSDSYYEYLLKAYLLLGDEEYLRMFADLYNPIMKHMKVASDEGYKFMVDVNMDNGQRSKHWISSLGAFWPGMQALLGHQDDAMDLHHHFTQAWRTFGWIPEQFDWNLKEVHSADPGYRLRPEHIESNFMLFSLTGSMEYVQIAANILDVLKHNKVQCGYADINHVHHGHHNDVMESFFLSETLKYLYMTFAEAPGIVDYYVLTTEAHFLSPFTHQDDPSAFDSLISSEPTPPECSWVCRTRGDQEREATREAVGAAYPLLALSETAADLLQARRCRACRVVVSR